MMTRIAVKLTGLTISVLGIAILLFMSLSFETVGDYTAFREQAGFWRDWLIEGPAWYIPISIAMMFGGLFLAMSFSDCGHTDVC